MSKEDKNDIKEMVKIAKQLSKDDPQGFMLVKNTIDTLKARADLEKLGKEEEWKTSREVKECGF